MSVSDDHCRRRCPLADAEPGGHARISLARARTCPVRMAASQGTGDRLAPHHAAPHCGADQWAGPVQCIDAVGMEATHGTAHVHLYDRLKQAVRSEIDRPHALRQAVRSGGVSGIGV